VPPKLKRLSGKELLSILSKYGFSVHSQRGSHVKLRRTLPSGEIQSLTTVMHDELDYREFAGYFSTGQPLYSGRATEKRILFGITLRKGISYKNSKIQNVILKRNSDRIMSHQ
jgi:predicted RNA binding protein YcfA (HicA-like mRNA interferase family)